MSFNPNDPKYSAPHIGPNYINWTDAEAIRRHWSDVSTPWKNGVHDTGDEYTQAFLEAMLLYHMWRKFRRLFSEVIPSRESLISSGCAWMKSRARTDVDDRPMTHALWENIWTEIMDESKSMKK